MVPEYADAFANVAMTRAHGVLVMRLHTEYVQGQMKALTEQASDIGQTMGRAAMDAAKPKT